MYIQNIPNLPTILHPILPIPLSLWCKLKPQ